MTTVTTMTTMTENHNRRTLVRIALQARDALRFQIARQFRDIDSQALMLRDHLTRVEEARRRLAICQVRGWLLAAEKIVDQVRSATRDVPYAVSLVERAIEGRQTHMPKLGEIVAELSQLEEEFAELRCDLKAGTVSAVTEPIELEGVYLGPFEIRLPLANLSQPRPTFYIVALDPNPAASNQAVTHPHVSDEHLCCGEAVTAIHAALRAGRLADFFCIVRSVLQTYNPHSPYISLDYWNGQPCHDCGYVMPSDEAYYCTSCDEEYCGECSTSCNHCGDTTCQGCIQRCPVCGDPYCGSCMTTCPDCDRQICRDCLDDNQCPCHDQPQEQDDDDIDTEDLQEHDPDQRDEGASAPVTPPGRAEAA